MQPSRPILYHDIILHDFGIFTTIKASFALFQLTVPCSTTTRLACTATGRRTQTAGGGADAALLSMESTLVGTRQIQGSSNSCENIDFVNKITLRPDIDTGSAIVFRSSKGTYPQSKQDVSHFICFGGKFPQSK